MYSLLPAIVASIFFGYGIFVVCAQGASRVALSFFALCMTSFFWQGVWAVLFQVRDPHIADFLVRFGYLFILFLPTSLYHFLTEIGEAADERRFVYFSYGFAAMLAVFLPSDLVVAGVYDYFWGYYPRAGILHPVHILQTFVVVNRGLYLVYRQQKRATGNKRTRLQLCMGALFIYFLAAVDYACNYGAEFYPPGVVFIAISLGIVTIAIVRYGLMNPMAVAASVAHELRTPLASIRMQADGMRLHLPELLAGYRAAVAHGLHEAAIEPRALRHLEGTARTIAQQVDRTSQMLNMLLASARTERIDASAFSYHSINALTAAAIERYAFEGDERSRVQFRQGPDFRIYGSEALLTMVLFNLLKNGIYAVKAAGKGIILVETERGAGVNVVRVTDTGSGIERDALPYIFDAFYTTKHAGGSGLGLAFCSRVMQAFGGAIRCDSEHGQYTAFTLEFPVVDDSANDREAAPARAGALA